jgi:hypothetical protein
MLLCALAYRALTTARCMGLPQVPAEAGAVEAVGATLDETAAAEDSSCVQSDSEVQESRFGLCVLLCPCAYHPVQTQDPTGASSGTGHIPPQASRARQPPSVALPDGTSPEAEHENTIAEMGSALDASRVAELALQRQITDLRAELRRATTELSSRAETQPSVPDTTQPPQEPYIVNTHPHWQD